MYGKKMFWSPGAWAVWVIICTKMADQGMLVVTINSPETRQQRMQAGMKTSYDFMLIHRLLRIRFMRSASNR